MGQPIKLDVLANVRGFQAGTDDVADALDDVADALDDVVRDGERGNDKLERSFRELASNATRSGDDIGDGIGKGFKRAGDGVDDFKQEANQSMRETAASISSVEDGLDAVQEIAANAFVGFGPVGAGAGLVAALGLGLVTEELRAQQEEADELKARLTGAYLDAAEEGRKALSVQQVLEESKAIYADTERLAQATEDAARFAVDRQLVIQAMAGDEDALNAIIARGNDLREDELSKVRDSGETLEAQQAKIDGINAKYGTLIERYDEQLALQKTLKSNAEEYAGLVDEQNRKTAEGNTAAKAAVDERGRALQAYADKAATIPNPVLVPSLDTSRADGELSRFIARKRPQIEVDVFYKPGRKVD